MLKYEFIELELEKHIVNDKLQQGDKLPNLETLMENFNASKSTVTKALDLLERRGIIYQVRGSGIFVRRHKRKGYISLLSNQGFTKDLEEFELTADVIDLKVIKPTLEVAQNLNMNIENDVYYLKRVRYIHGQPLCLEESYYNKKIVTYLNKETATESIFEYLQSGLGLKIGFLDSFLHVGVLKEQEAKHLGLKAGLPKLDVEGIFHLTNGQPFDFSKVTYNYEQAQFYVQSND